MLKSTSIASMAGYPFLIALECTSNQAADLITASAVSLAGSDSTRSHPILLLKSLFSLSLGVVGCFMRG